MDPFSPSHGAPAARPTRRLLVLRRPEARRRPFQLPVRPGLRVQCLRRGQPPRRARLPGAAAGAVPAAGATPGSVPAVPAASAASAVQRPIPRVQVRLAGRDVRVAGRPVRSNQRPRVAQLVRMGGGRERRAPGAPGAGAPASHAARTGAARHRHQRLLLLRRHLLARGRGRVAVRWAEARGSARAAGLKRRAARWCPTSCAAACPRLLARSPASPTCAPAGALCDPRAALAPTHVNLQPRPRPHANRKRPPRPRRAPQGLWLQFVGGCGAERARQPQRAGVPVRVAQRSWRGCSDRPLPAARRSLGTNALSGALPPAIGGLTALNTLCV